MKTKMFLICILLILNLLTGCVPTSELFKTAIPATSATQAFASPSLSSNGEIPTPIITQTAATFAPSTPVPTLGADDAFELLQNYLKNKPPCQLPCWGGITPGKSTLDDVQKQLTVLAAFPKEPILVRREMLGSQATFALNSMRKLVFGRIILHHLVMRQYCSLVYPQEVLKAQQKALFMPVETIINYFLLIHYHKLS